LVGFSSLINLLINKDNKIQSNQFTYNKIMSEKEVLANVKGINKVKKLHFV